MGFIVKAVIFLFLLGLVVTIFEKIIEKIKGIDIPGNVKKEEKVLSPLEIELAKIKPYAYQRTEEIAKYIIPLYPKDYAKMGNLGHFTSIDTIVSKYLDNQFLFSEKYEKHVIGLTGDVGTIGKDGKNVYITIGNNDFCHMGDGSSTTGESVRRLIKCYIDENDMGDENYKDLVLNMRPGAHVTAVGVLGKEEFGGFILYGTTLIEINSVVPDRIMNMAVNSIYEKYNIGKEHDSE